AGRGQFFQSSCRLLGVELCLLADVLGGLSELLEAVSASLDGRVKLRRRADKRAIELRADRDDVLDCEGGGCCRCRRRSTERLEARRQGPRELVDLPKSFLRSIEQRVHLGGALDGV